MSKRPDLAERNRTHGESTGNISTPEYNAYRQMIQRCYNTNRKDYKYYGGRGIKVYSGWIGNYSAFITHVGRKPTPQHSLDRIKNDEGYFPGNVKWSTQTEQLRNQQKTIIIEFNGRTQSLSQWAEETKINYKTLVQRMKMGWSIEHMLTIVPKKGQKIYEAC